MSRRITHNENNRNESVKNMGQNGWDNDLPVTGDDSILFRSFSDYMKGHLDIEDVINDPDLLVTREKVAEMITDYRTGRNVNNENEKFIKDIFSNDEPLNSNKDEILSIRQEIEEKNLDRITSEWIKEWNEKKQRTGPADPKTEEIRNFITESLHSTGSEDQIKSVGKDKKGFGRKLFLRYISISAAALIAVFLLLKTLLPSSNPENLFTNYYKPFDAVSPVTRNVNADLNNTYSSAISSYKKGDYAAASEGLKTVLTMEPTSLPAQFYMGLSQLAMGYSDLAIKHFLQVAGGSGEYNKEAQWYLGLSYLKTGNKQKASECFESLKKSNGYYHDRSEKILRRLK
jgi:TolA-binding protein